MNYKHNMVSCPDPFCRKSIFVKTLQYFEEMNAIKYGNPRKSKHSGCQNRERIDAYRNRDLPGCQQVIKTIDSDRTHYRPQNKINQPLHFSSQRAYDKHDQTYTQYRQHSACISHFISLHFLHSVYSFSCRKNFLRSTAAIYRFDLFM